MSLSNLNRFMKTLSKHISTDSTKQLKRRAIATVSRAKSVHKYRNRSWKLTNQLKYRIVRRSKEITFQSMYYGKYIINGSARRDGMKDNYIRNAWKYVDRKFKH